MVGSKKYSIGAIWFDKERKQEFVLLFDNNILIGEKESNWYTTRYIKGIGSERRANCFLFLSKYGFRKK